MTPMTGPRRASRGARDAEHGHDHEIAREPAPSERAQHEHGPGTVHAAMGARRSRAPAPAATPRSSQSQGMARRKPRSRRGGSWRPWVRVDGSCSSSVAGARRLPRRPPGAWGASARRRPADPSSISLRSRLVDAPGDQEGDQPVEGGQHDRPRRRPSAGDEPAREGVEAAAGAAVGLCRVALHALRPQEEHDLVVRGPLEPEVDEGARAAAARARCPRRPGASGAR